MLESTGLTLLPRSFVDSFPCAPPALPLSPLTAHHSRVHRLPESISGGLLDGLRQRRVGVHSMRQILVSGFQPARQSYLGDQLRRLGTNDRAAQQIAVSAVE